MIKSLLLVGLGGFAGSIARWSISLFMAQTSLFPTPWPTFLINLSGSFLLGLLLASLPQQGVYSAEWRLLLATGFCGSFTTFSTFSVENLQLIQQSEYSIALLYIGLSLAGGIAFAATGYWLGR